MDNDTLINQILKEFNLTGSDAALAREMFASGAPSAVARREFIAKAFQNPNRVNNAVQAAFRAIDIALDDQAPQVLQRKAELEAAHAKAQKYLAATEANLAERERLRKIAANPMALPADREAAAEALRDLPKSWKVASEALKDFP